MTTTLKRFMFHGRIQDILTRHLIVVLAILCAIQLTPGIFDTWIKPVLANTVLTEDNFTPGLLTEAGYTAYNYKNVILFAKKATPGSFGPEIGKNIVPIYLTAGTTVALYLSCKPDKDGKWST